ARAPLFYRRRQRLGPGPRAPRGVQQRKAVVIQLDDTIAAIATAPGEGAIGIVRLSGPDAAAVARRVFVSARTRSTSKRPRRGRSPHLYHGHVVDPVTGVPVDEVLLAYMRAPHTYTRQDVVEISAHG